MGGPLALVDCNNFYVSCERVFQPELRGRPVVVLSNNDHCVIARSNEAKTLGIAIGAPWHLHRGQLRERGRRSTCAAWHAWILSATFPTAKASWPRAPSVGR